jgi:hypothetical protein
MKMKVKFIFILFGLALSASVWADPAEAPEDLRKEVEALQAEVAALKAAGHGSDQLAELRRRIDLLAEELERLRTGGATDAEEPGKREPGLGPGASKVYGRTRGVSIGGYGEAVYDHPSSSRQDGMASGLEPRIDLLRYVTYFGYKFSDRILLNSEIEFEHATTGEGGEERGEASVEFAYLELRPWESTGLRVGQVLLPLGFVNELHEPPIFRGAHRNEVETQIIPSTWPETGAGAFGGGGAVQWRAYVVAGLSSAGFSSEGIEEGRQKGSQSLARNVALTARLDFTGLSGLLVGASVFTGKSGQGAETGGQPIGGLVTLFDLHAQYEHGGFEARGLWAQSRINDVALINAQNGLSGDESVGERQYGWYLEAAYDLMALRPAGQWSVTPFVRYERLNPQARVPTGYSRDPSLDQRVVTAGLGVKPLANVVFKADYRWLRNDARTGANRFSLAAGYLF